MPPFRLDPDPERDWRTSSIFDKNGYLTILSVPCTAVPFVDQVLANRANFPQQSRDNESRPTWRIVRCYFPMMLFPHEMKLEDLTAFRAPRRALEAWDTRHGVQALFSLGYVVASRT
jgi:hypothetical protein